jgi:hypothetical protein
MKTKKPILVLVILLVLVYMQGQARAGGVIFYTGNYLVEIMREYDKLIVSDPRTSLSDASTYMGYIAGVSDAVSGLLWENLSGVTVDQICSIVAKYLKNHPERWNEPAATLVVDALKEAFPRKK